MPVLPALAAAASSFFRCLTATGRAALRWFAPGHQSEVRDRGERKLWKSDGFHFTQFMKKENNLFLPRIVFFFYHFIQYRGRNKSPYGSSSWFQPSHIASEPACETAILKRYCKTSEVQRLQVHSVGGMFGYWEFLEMGIPQVTRVSILNRSNDLDALEYLHDLGTPLWKMICLRKIPMFGYVCITGLSLMLPEKQRLRYNATTSCPVVLPRKSGKASTERGSFQHVMLS